MRIKPSLMVGVLVLIGYLAVVFAVWALSGLRYGGLMLWPVILIGCVSVWRILQDDGDVVEPGADQLRPFEAVAA